MTSNQFAWIKSLYYARFMRILLLLFVFGLMNVSAKSPTWNFDKNITLKKDEIYQGTISKDTLKKSFSFRWTLYKNKGLVVLVNYDKFPYQFILYKDYQRDTFRLKLFGDDSLENISYLFITFKDFDQDKNLASIWLGVSGEAQFLEQQGR